MLVCFLKSLIYSQNIRAELISECRNGPKSGNNDPIVQGLEKAKSLIRLSPFKTIVEK